MKVLSPKFDISLSIIQLTPAEAGSVAAIAESMGLRTEWVENTRTPYTAALVYFDSLEALANFQVLLHDV